MQPCTRNEDRAVNVYMRLNNWILHTTFYDSYNVSMQTQRCGQKVWIDIYNVLLHIDNNVVESRRWLRC